MATCDQAEPFHCRIALVVGLSPSPSSPTAQALPEGREATPVRFMLPSPAGFGTWLQTFPFHRAIRLSPGPHPQSSPSPTAHAARRDEAATLPK